MKRLFIASLLLCICLPDHSQVLQGIVVDKNTNQPLINVSVFFNGTTIGTKTGRNGFFTLSAPVNQKFPLAVSAIGYNSVRLTEYPSDKVLMIALEPKIYQLDEVVITSRRTLAERSARNYYLSTFRRQFLGETANAYACRVLNENDLVFVYDEYHQLLTAYTMGPLIISNKSLGYQIMFYLDAFKYSQDPYLMSYSGYFVFSEDSTMNEKERIRAEKRRRLAFLGSRMHFIRSLWENKLDSAGFTLKNSANKIISYDSLVIQKNSTEKTIWNKGKYDIAYLSKTSRSAIEVLNDTVYFNQLGYFDPYGLNWIGEMSRQRVADLLPFDYVLK